MKQIITIAENPLFKKNSDGTLISLHELIFIWSEPSYALVDEAKAVTIRKSSDYGQYRMIATDDQLRELAAVLLSYTEDATPDGEEVSIHETAGK